MVSLVWAAIASSLGLLCYLAIPFVGQSLPIDLRNRVAQFYYGLGTRAIGQPAIIRRKVGGYSLMEWKMDDEKGAGKVTLDDSLLGDSKDLHFDDPDNRLKRWKQKPLALLHEEVPAVLDAELAELGKRWREHRRAGEHWHGNAFNPYFEVPTGDRCVNLDDAKALILNGSEPSDPTTMEDYTRKRFEKYGSHVGAVEVFSTLTGVAVGWGLIAASTYINQQLLDGAAGGAGAPIDVPLWLFIQVLPL